MFDDEAAAPANATASAITTTTTTGDSNKQSAVNKPVLSKPVLSKPVVGSFRTQPEFGSSRASVSGRAAGADGAGVFSEKQDATTAAGNEAGRATVAAAAGFEGDNKRLQYQDSE